MVTGIRFLKVTEFLDVTTCSMVSRDNSNQQERDKDDDEKNKFRYLRQLLEVSRRKQGRYSVGEQCCKSTAMETDCYSLCNFKGRVQNTVSFE